MVRRSAVDRSPQPDLYSAGYEPPAGNQQTGNRKRPRSGSGWRGAGGRWLVWTFRVVVWAVLLIIGWVRGRPDVAACAPARRSSRWRP